MKTFFKIIFLLIVLISIAGVISYSVYKDDLREEIRLRLQEKLSLATGYPISIGSVKYVPFQSISLDHVTVYSPEAPGIIIADTDNIIITIDMLTAVEDKQLNMTITTNGIHSGDILSRGVVRTISKKSDTFEGVFDPSLIYSVSIMDGLVSIKNFMIRDVDGILDLDNLTIPKGKLSFTYKGTKYLADFQKMETQSGYNVSLHSDILGLTTEIVKNENRLIVDNLEGMYRTLHFDLEGEIVDLTSPDVTSSFNGTLETELGTFPLLPGKIGKVARDLDLQGKVSANIFFKTTGTSLEKIEASSTIQAKDIFLDKFWIKEITTKITLKDGRLEAPLINGEIYNGVLSGNFKTDIWEKGCPFMLSMVLTSTNFESLMTDMNNNTEGVYGVLDGDIDLEGYLSVVSSYRGSGSFTISDANLGPMPIATPLLGDLYASVKHLMPKAEMVNINHAYMDFDIENRKLTTDNLTFLGDNIYVHSEGYLDFDGTLDFSFENRFREAPSEDEGWQVALRNSMIYVGKFIKKSRLYGTIQNPEWGI